MYTIQHPNKQPQNNNPKAKAKKTHNYCNTVIDNVTLFEHNF